ncbi:MAG: endonuclease III [Elusimicrobiota bacterium]
MTPAERKQQARAAVRALRRLYPDAHCELDFSNPLELAVAVILSAQCTDKRVNMITKDLFKKYRTARDYAAAKPGQLEKMIRPAGFFNAKAKSIRAFSQALVDEHGGKVPDAMADLLKLRGVARKTANVILGTAFGKSEGIVVDTHMKRVSYRLALTDEKDPVKIERDLMACVPRKEWNFFGHGMVWHGRRACYARNPACPSCSLRKFCPQRGV